jgi:beta-lactamase class A
VVLALATAVVALGPGVIRDAISGLLFTRPHAGTTVVTPHADGALQAELRGIGDSLSTGRMAASVVDLQSGAASVLDAERAYPAASLFKLPVLISVLAEEDAGRLDPERTLEIQQRDWTDGSGVLQARVGERLSVRELTRLMIQESDNIAALVLLDVLGVPRVNALAAQLGLRSTRLVDHRAGEPGDHTTSAADMALLFQMLATGSAVSQHVSEGALQLLESRQTVAWLSDGLPFWVKVAHKWGDLPDARNDAGIVFTPHGSYVAVALTRDAEPDEAARAITRVSRLMYERLAR